MDNKEISDYILCQRAVKAVTMNEAGGLWGGIWEVVGISSDKIDV